MTATVNGIRAISVRLVFPWRGVWFADIDLDPENAAAAPTGKATLVVGSSTLIGTVDPRYTGRFVSTVRLRLVGGGGGWSNVVAAQDWANDAGVSSSDVYRAIGAQVGEVVNDVAPTSLGVHYTVSAGPASRVFGDRDWFVDLAGVTQVVTRPAGQPDTSLEILAFDGSTQRVEVASDAVLLPGTILTDPRFDGKLIVRDVEQYFTTQGSRATAWCSGTNATRLMSALTNFVREASGRTYLRVYKYRFVSATASRLNLQAIDRAPGLPDVLPVSVFPGGAGLSAKLTPSMTVLVMFAEGDPAQPMVVGFEDALPIEATIDATAKVNIGPTAPVVSLAGGSGPLVLAVPYNGLLAALGVFGAALNGTAVPGTPAPNEIAAAGLALANAITALPPPATVRTVAA